jgi:Tfp pilus assembly protein PilN
VVGWLAGWLAGWWCIFRMISFVVDGGDEQQVELPTLQEAEQESVPSTKRKISELQKQLASMKPNMAAIAEYKQKKQEYEQRMQVGRDRDSVCRQ